MNYISVLFLAECSEPSIYHLFLLPSHPHGKGELLCLKLTIFPALTGGRIQRPGDVGFYSPLGAWIGGNKNSISILGTHNHESMFMCVCVDLNSEVQNCNACEN